MIFCARRTHAVESLLCSDAMPRRERRRSIVGWPHDDRCDARTFGFIGQPALFKPRPLESTLPSPVPSCPNASPMCPSYWDAIFSPLRALRLFARASLCPPASDGLWSKGAHWEGELGFRMDLMRRADWVSSSSVALPRSADEHGIHWPTSLSEIAETIV